MVMGMVMFFTWKGQVFPFDQTRVLFRLVLLHQQCGMDDLGGFGFRGQAFDVGRRRFSEGHNGGG